MNLTGAIAIGRNQRVENFNYGGAGEKKSVVREVRRDSVVVEKM